MVELVRDDGVLWTENGFEQASVSVETSGVQDCVFHAEEVRNTLLEGLVDTLGAADEAHGSQAETPGV